MATTPSASSAATKIDGCGFVRPCAFEPDDGLHVEAVVGGELLEIALPVRDEPDPQPVAPQLVEHGEGVLVEGEVLVPLPLAHHVHCARPRSVGPAPHPAHDVLRERDPHLLVVHEIASPLQLLDRSEPRPVVPPRIEHKPVPLPKPPVPLGPQLRPRPKQGEVDVEKNRAQHRQRIGRTARTGASWPEAGLARREAKRGQSRAPR